MRRGRVREALNVSEGGAFDTGDEAMGGGRGGGGQRVVEELEARRAEGRRMETEDARGAEATIDASKLNVVEKPPVLGAAVAAYGRRADHTVGSGGINRGGRRGF